MSICVTFVRFSRSSIVEPIDHDELQPRGLRHRDLDPDPDPEPLARSE